MNILGGWPGRAVAKVSLLLLGASPAVGMKSAKQSCSHKLSSFQEADKRRFLLWVKIEQRHTAQTLLPR